MKDLLLAITQSLEKYLPDSITLAEIGLLAIGISCLLIVLVIVMIFKVNQLKKSLTTSQKKIAAQKNKTGNLQDQLHQTRIREAKVITLLKNERRHASDKLKLLEEARGHLSTQFETLAHRIFDEKSDKLSDLNKEKLESILTPFNTQLSTFKQEINDIYRNDSRERLSLKNEITHLKDLNQQINKEAINLTKALKGDTKTQGTWGELVLERVLEITGLQKGREYEIQTSLRNDENKLLRPDVIIQLPGDKQIVVDSKVSLINWERYVNSKGLEEKQTHLTQLIQNIRTHITSLSDKNYPNLKNIRSLDFVLMFIPIEGAFSVAAQTEPEILEESLNQNIVIVTPTTLLATLRTIENLWQYEHQSKNSLEIARKAGLMYDKFRGFVEELTKIGNQLASCQTSYDGALAKLSKGRGNLISQAEHLKKLGIQTKKDIPKTIVDRADIEL